MRVATSVFVNVRHIKDLSIYYVVNPSRASLNSCKFIVLILCIHVRLFCIVELRSKSKSD